MAYLSSMKFSAVISLSTDFSVISVYPSGTPIRPILRLLELLFMSLNFSFIFLNLFSPSGYVLFDLCVLSFAFHLCSAFWSISLLSFKISWTLDFISKMSNWFLFIATSFLFHHFISCVIGVVPFLTYLNLLPCLLVTSVVLLEGSVWSLCPQMAVISRVEFVVSPEWWHFSSVLCASWFWVHLLRPELGWALVRPLSCLCPSPGPVLLATRRRVSQCNPEWTGSEFLILCFKWEVCFWPAAWGGFSPRLLLLHALHSHVSFRNLALKTTRIALSCFWACMCIFP